MYKVFCDFHHASLLNSLIMLFEGRLGGCVYRPIGREWYEQGFWKVHDHPATVAQYLDVGGATPDGTPPLNDSGSPMRTEWSTKDQCLFHCHDIDSGETNKAITLSYFMNTPIDFVIATLPQHIEPFRRLCDLHKDHPKLIFQIGNEWNAGAHQNMIDGIMSSARVYLPPGIPSVIYHQEFDLSVFSRADIETGIDSRRITSFVNCFDVADIFTHDWHQFEEIEHLMSPIYEFRAYGGQCRDGSANGSEDLAARIRDAKFIWHVKKGGDGYGHILHNAAAMGRPLIVKMGYYMGKLGADLLIPDVTCIAIDGLTHEQVIAKIRHFSAPEQYGRMSENLYNRFKEVVDFDREYVEIRDFLQRIVGH